MISAQIDELRELVGDGSMEWVAGPVRASVLREAADTIWELRDDLQRANAENAKLRELVAELYQCSRQCGCDRCGYKDGCAIFDRMAQLGVEVE